MKSNVIQVQKWNRPQLPTEEVVEQLLLEEGLSPERWVGEPGQIFQASQRDYSTVIFVVSGFITFGFPIVGDPTILRSGDRLDLPAGILHNAVVGQDGVICLEAHKEINK